MNRRNFLKTVGAGAGAALVGSNVMQALAASDLPEVFRVAATADTRDPISHVLNRITFGPRPGQVDAVRKMGLQAYIDQQFNPASINDNASEKRLGDYITLDMTDAEINASSADNGGRAAIELDSATIMRAMYSERQLFEVMVGFWSEHFSIYHGKDTCRTLKTVDDREVVRKYALGKFRDLLGASAKSPAMLIYLDNAVSSKAHPNENYAREVMELHTITVGNYTETDVKEVARCFTGWTLQGQNGTNPGTFIYRAALHDDGEKTVLGKKIPAGGGIKDGEMVLDMLASHPGAAQHIASKLVRRFISDDPPASVVSAAANTFLSSGGDIPSVLRTIFAAPEFASAPPKFKRPSEFLISLFRAFDMQVNGDLNANILGLFKTMGQLPFDHITPDGYTDYAQWWEGNMLDRWNVAIMLAYGGNKNAKTDPLNLAHTVGNATDAHGVISFFAQLLLGRTLIQAELDTIWAYASKNGEPKLDSPTGQKTILDTIALVAATPAAQYR